MQSQDKINAFYNTHAESYAKRYLNELQYKHLDRIVLREFATTNGVQGRAADFGCGPGQTTRFLHDNGLKEIVGIDISHEMIATARALHPGINFVEASMLELPFDDGYFSSAVAFYAIVNLDYDQVTKAFLEIHRVLKPRSEFLVCFHTGNEVIHLGEFEGNPADVDFYLFEPDRMIRLLHETGFQVLSAYERYAYPDEYPSKRAYLWMWKEAPAG